MSSNDTPDRTETAISIQSLVKEFGQKSVIAGIDMEVRCGEVFGLLGPNGAGKTTTIEMVAGLKKPTIGSVRVLGLDPATQRHEFTRKVSVQPQAASLFPTLTVVETLHLFSSFYDNPLSADEVSSLVGLDGALASRVKNLSGGQSRRLLIGLAVIGRPKIVILDEPSAGLDPAARQELWSLIRSLRDQEVTVLLTTHHMDEAMELCDRIAIMISGRLVAEGSPEQIVAEHTTSSTVRFMVDADTDPHTLHEVSPDDDYRISEIPGALLISIDTVDPYALLSQVTLHREIHATGIQVASGSLEDVFLKLAGEVDQGWNSVAPGAATVHGKRQ